MTGSVTTDINGERQNPDVRMLDTLADLVSNTSHEAGQLTALLDPGAGTIQPCNHPTAPVISYTIRGRTTLLNHWDDPRYFTAAFSTLFPTSVGGHLEQRTFPVSLAAFAEWALSHHSRRYFASASNT